MKDRMGQISHHDNYEPEDKSMISIYFSDPFTSQDEDIRKAQK